MLTAKVGKEIINCTDGKYDRYRLKQWSNKSILKCPVCDGDYEYCHGEIKLPYFRHVGKECEGYYSESETEEHMKGKQILYDWIKEQEGVTNCKMEHWIPETKQRPDIYFEQDGKRYVIEFQCTPIASEFLLRRELYKLAGINDIWILGTKKYNFETSRMKTIEKNKKLVYLDVFKNNIMIDIYFLSDNVNKVIETESNTSSLSTYSRSVNKYEYIHQYNINLHVDNVNNFKFNDNIVLADSLLSEFEIANEDYINENKMKEEKNKLRNEACDYIEKNIEVISNKISSKEYINNFDISVQKNSYSLYYKSSIFMYINNNHYYIFIKEDSMDFCYRGKSYINLNKIDGITVDKISTFNFLKDSIEYILTNEKNKYDKNIKFNNDIKKHLGKFENSEIILLRQFEHKPYGKFVFLRGFEDSNDYFFIELKSKLNMLYKKGVNNYSIMIPKYVKKNSYGMYYKNMKNQDIISVFNHYGFKNVRFIDEEEVN